MGYEIWVCEDLVIVFLTETCHRIAVVSESGHEKQRVVMSTQTEELEIHPCPKEFSSGLQAAGVQAHLSERRVIKSVNTSYS